MELFLLSQLTSCVATNRIEKQINIMREGKKHINFAMSKGTNSFPTGKKRE
jgi:hypothetical protein